MKWTVERQVDLGLGSSLLLLCVVIAISYASTARWVAQSGAIQRAMRIETQLANLMNAVTNAETGQRGFVITGLAPFLEPYESANDEIERARGILGILQDDPAQVDRLQAIDALVARRLRIAEDTINLRRTGGLEAARAAVESGRGRELHDEIRRAVAVMNSVEAARIARLGSEMRSRSRVTLVLLALCVALALAMATGSIHQIRRSLRHQRRIKADLQAANALHQGLLDGADYAIIAGDESGVSLFNRGAERLLGYTADEIVGKQQAAMFHDPAEVVARAEELTRELGRPVAPGMEAILAKARSGEPDQGEWTYLRKDGSRVPVLLSVTALRNAQGEVVSFLGIAQDYSRRKRAAQELEAALERAESADRLKSAFLATMSHELRTPLNSIIGFTGTLLQGLAGPLLPEQDKQLTMVRDSARHLLSLINDVLDISKIEAGEMVVHRSPFDLGASLARIAALVEPQACRRGLVLRTDFREDLGPWVGDQRRFEQVILNLLSNALKFTEEGSVTLAAAVTDGHLRIEVADTGIGIAADGLAGLFQPFRQIDTGLSRNHEGTGLGLAICRRLVELMGGGIRASSEPGHGSIFTVVLPHVEMEQS